MTQLLIPQAGAGRSRLLPGAVTDLVSPAPRDIWRGVLADDPGATALQTPEYFDAVLAATGGSDVSRFYQLRDGRQLLLPLVRRRTPFGVTVDAGYPGGYGHGGMLATGGLLADDVRTVVPDLRGQSLSIRIGGAHHTREQWTAGLLPGVVEEPRRVEVIDLEEQLGAASDLRETFTSRKTRQQLRRAVRSGVEVETDTTGRLIPTFYDIYRAWVERWIPRSGLPPLLARRLALKQEPYHKFATVAAMAGELCRVFVAWHEGRPVAASIMLSYGQHAIGWRSYSIKELSAPVSANLLTQVTGLEDAISLGCRYADLGQSGGSGNLQHYKSLLGATGRSAVDLRIEPVGLTRMRVAKERAEGVLVRAFTGSSASPTLGAPKPVGRDRSE